MIMLDIINSNIYSRPIYFSAKQELFPGSLQQEGMIYRLLPLPSSATPPTAASVKKTEEFLTKNFVPTFSFSKTPITISNNFDFAVMDLYTTVADYYLSKGMKEPAAKWALQAAELFNNPEIPVSFSTIKTGSILLKTGKKDKALSLLETMAVHTYALYKNPSAVNLAMNREAANYFITEVEKVLLEDGLSSEKVSKMLEELSGEE